MLQSSQEYTHSEEKTVNWEWGPSRSRRIAVGFYSLLLVFAVTGFGLTALALEIQSSVRAYVTAESLWSKAQKETVYLLDRFASTGDARDLDRARQALKVPLADRRARLDLEQTPQDRESAVRAFIEAQNHPDEARRMVWLFIYFESAPYFRDAIAHWRASDPYILRLDSIADQMEAQVGVGGLGSVRMEALRQEVDEIVQAIRPLQDGFTEALGEGSRWLDFWLKTVASIVISGLTLVTGLIFWWSTRRIVESEHEFRDTFEQTTIGMAQIDPKGRLMVVNNALCTLLGYAPHELEQCSLEELFHPDQGPVESVSRLLAQNADQAADEYRLVGRDGATLWCKLSVSTVNRKWHGHHHLILGVENVTEAHELLSELQHLARHDPLTGTINRRGFEEDLDRVVTEAREWGSQHALCFIDLDQFKIVNDTAGHPAGDECLRDISRLLRRELRQTDVLARLGGDEFGVILRDCGASAANEVAEKLRKMLEDYLFTSDEVTIRLGASIGWVSIEKGCPDPNGLLKAADTACYMAKQYGRNRVVQYSPKDWNIQMRQSELDSLAHIRAALTEERFILHAQAIRPVDTGTLPRCEVLVRMLDQHDQEVLPGQFLPAAERYHFVAEIDRWVVRNTLDTLARYPEQLEQLEACHINLSGQSIGREDFLSFLEATLDQSPVDASKLCFEITETAAISNLSDAWNFFRRLQSRGCEFALDDFGSGLSSYGYLTKMPVDLIKIDGTFVRDALEDEIHQAVVRSITDIVNLMNKRTIAEFVESDAIATRMSELGVAYLQGYGVHRPCPLEDLLGELDPKQGR